jgi:hypothetical protein
MKFFYTIIFWLSLFNCASAQWITTQWVPSNNGLPTPLPDINALAVNGTRIFAGTSDGLFISDDFAANWSPANYGGTNYNHVYEIFISDSNIYLGTSQGVFLSTNNGVNWMPRNSGISNLLIKDIVKSGNNLFVTSYPGVNPSSVYLSSDNGLSWTQLSDVISLPSASTFRLFSIIVNGNRIFSGGDGLYYSDDNGNSWINIPGFEFNSNRKVYDLIKSGSNIIAATHLGIYTSIDNGLTWSLTTNHYKLGFPLTLFYNNNLTYVGGTDNYGVNVSLDNGLSWFIYPTNVSQSFNDSEVLALAMDSLYVYAGTQDNPDWLNNIGVMKFPVSQLTTTHDIDVSSNFMIWPNPFSLQTTLTFTYFQKNDLIKIIDLYGKVVQVSNFTGKKFEIYRENLSSGIYFVQITNEQNNVFTQKIIIQ